MTIATGSFELSDGATPSTYSPMVRREPDVAELEALAAEAYSNPLPSLLGNAEVQNVILPLRPATVSVAKFALAGSMICRSAVRMNQGVRAKL